MFQRLCPPAVLLAALPLALMAQNTGGGDSPGQTKDLQHEVTVTANRIETPAWEVASSITVISRRELDRSKQNNLLAVLEDIPGLSIIQTGPMGSSASAFLRGANSEHILIMMDGVELNDPMTPSRSLDLAHLTLDNVERIEILRGPQSTLYGSDALAGVINIITTRGEGPPRGRFRAQGGSYGSLNGSLEYGGGTDTFHFSMGSAYSKTSGFSAAPPFPNSTGENDGYRNTMLFGKLGFSPSRTVALDLTLRTLRTRIDLDNFSGAYRDDPNNVQDYDAFFFKAEARLRLMSNLWEQKFILAGSDSLRRNENAEDDLHPGEFERARYKSRLIKLAWQNNLFLHEANTLVWGLEFQQERGESEYSSTSSFGTLSSPFPSSRTRTLGFYAQDRLSLGGNVHATLGGRVDRHSQFGTSLTFRAAPAVLIPSSGTKIKATLGTGFKSPSLYQLFSPASDFGPIGNPDLSPEESLGWDIGFEQALGSDSIHFGASYFQTRLKNLIDFDFLSGYINIAEARTRGWELSGSARLMPNLVLRSNYTRTEAIDRENGLALLRRPRDKFSASLAYSHGDRIFCDITWTQVGSREDMDYSTWPSRRIRLSGFSLVQAVVSTRFNRDFEIFLRLDNLLDADYEWVKGYQTAGFSLYAGLEIGF